jgi:hypothetical protein
MRDQHFSVVSRVLERYKFQKKSVLQSAQEVVDVLNNSTDYLKGEKQRETQQALQENEIRKQTGKKPRAVYCLPVESKAVYYNIPAQEIFVVRREITQVTNYYNLQNILENGKFVLKSTIFSDLSTLYDVRSGTKTDKIATQIGETVVTIIEKNTPELYEETVKSIKKLSDKRQLINDIIQATGYNKFNLYKFNL